LKKIINLDVSRTYQDKDLFQNTAIKELMVNILFIWSKENEDVSYKQGMNELLAVLLFGLYPFYFKNPYKLKPDQLVTAIKTEKSKYNKEIYHFFHDEEDLSADLYALFEAVMNKGIKELFDNNTKRDSLNNKKFELFQQQWTDEPDSEIVRKIIKNKLGTTTITKKMLFDY
jgi:hypothetical protein